MPTIVCSTPSRSMSTPVCVGRRRFGGPLFPLQSFSVTLDVLTRLIDFGGPLGGLSNFVRLTFFEADGATMAAPLASSAPSESSQEGAGEPPFIPGKLSSSESSSESAESESRGDSERWRRRREALKAVTPIAITFAQSVNRSSYRGKGVSLNCAAFG